jgi:hypothetical protein
MADFIAVHVVLPYSGSGYNDSKNGANMSFDPALCNQCLESDFDETQISLYGPPVGDNAMKDLPHPVAGDGDTEPGGWGAMIRPSLESLNIMRGRLDEAFRDFFIASTGSRFLDMHGERAKFPRAEYETDDCYRARFIRFNALRRDVYEFSVPVIADDGTVRRYLGSSMRLLGTVMTVIEAVLEDLPFVHTAKVRCGDDIVSWTVFAETTVYPDEDKAHIFYFMDDTDPRDEDLNVWIFSNAAPTHLILIDLWRAAVTPWPDSERALVRTLIETHFVEACAGYILRLHTANESIV